LHKNKAKESKSFHFHVEETEEKGVGEIKIQEDFYAVAFNSRRHKMIKRYNITPELAGRTFYACLWIYLIELTIIALVFKT